MESPENISNRLKRFLIINDLKNIVSIPTRIIIRQIEKEISTYNTFDEEVPPEDVIKLLHKNFNKIEEKDRDIIIQYLRDFNIDRLISR